MTCQSLNLLHAWVLPKNDLVERVAVSAHYLVRRLREHEVTDLGACVNGMKRLERMCVPETNVTVRSASTSRQKTVLVG